MDELSTKYVPPHYSTANFSQTYNIIIDHGVITPGQDR